MPSVGPELPSYLTKRKRSNSDSNHPSSPPTKILAAAFPRTLGPTLPPVNPDTIELDESSENEYGPSTKLSPPGKVIEAFAAPSNPDALDLENSSEDDYGPPAPKFKPAPLRRVLGPAPPPANFAEMPSHAANPDDDESSSDDDFGPSLPPAPGSAAEASMLQERYAEETRSAAVNEPEKPKRDDWMIVPPSDSDWGSRQDPTKLKSRKFASGKGAKAPAEKSGISAIWTETPAEKRQRLEDEVLGRKDAATSSRGGGAREEKGPETEDDRRTARRIREYNEKNRGKSMMEEHNGRAGKKSEEDDPSKRGFDREKDMALGGRLGHGQKKELLAKAADFGSRFQKGKYL